MPFDGLSPEQIQMFNSRMVENQNHLKALDSLSDFGMDDILGTALKFAPIIGLALLTGGAGAGLAEGAVAAEAGAAAEGAGEVTAAEDAASSGKLGGDLASEGSDVLQGGAGEDMLGLANPSTGLISSAISDTPAWETQLGQGWEGAAADSASQNAALQTATPVTNPPPSGDGILDWANKNKLLALGGLQVIGGVGNAFLQEHLLDKKIEADKQLLRQRMEQQQELENWKRKFTQGGSYFDANVPQPGGNGVLTRPGTGAPVYSPNGGLISSGIH